MSILQRVKRAATRAAMRSVGRYGRYTWQINEVVKAQSLPAAMQRTYLEHRLLREVMAGVGRRFEFAADVGCGFGRNIPVLEEFARSVVGFEREPQFRALAQTLHPAALIRDYPVLNPDGGRPFDFSLTFTFVQHLSDDAARTILEALKQATKGGVVLLVEDVAGPTLPYDPKTRGDRMYLPRPMATYEEWMAPWTMTRSWPRPVETTFSPPGWAGRFMLFSDQ